jgi:hypothetical protein
MPSGNKAIRPSQAAKKLLENVGFFFRAVYVLILIPADVFP